MNDVSVRHATTSDASPIKDIIDLSFSRFFRFFASHSVGSEEGQLIVAESKGGIAGFAKLIEFHVNGVKYGCILWIAVHPALRRRGIALKLAKRGNRNVEGNRSKSGFCFNPKNKPRVTAHYS